MLGETGLDSRLEAAERGGLTPYSGRSAELASLQAQVELARRGEGRLVLVVGEAGSGKSRMLLELRAQVAASEFRSLQGRCRSYGGMTSYLPFVEALHGALGVKEQRGEKPDVPRVVARIRAIDRSLEPLIPLYLHLLSMPSEMFPLPRHLRGEHLQAAMLDALAAIFTSYAQRSPTLLLLEDWHWADDASRRALRRLTEVVAGSPLLIAVTTRPEPGTLVDAQNSDHAARINLGPLDFSASLAIIKAVLTVQRVPEELARRLHERTGGNPFFLEEMCHALREAGVVAAHGAEAVLSGSPGALQLPDSVQAVIRSRLDRLNPRGREVLRVASVIGREFTRRILSDAMGAADVMLALEQLKNAGIIQQTRVVPDPVYRFKHVLTQEVTYESLLEHQRKALHLAVGQAIERSQPGSLDEPLELLAYHFSRAEAWQQAIEYGLRAAARATELSQFADALGMLEQVQSWLARLPGADAPRDRLADVLLRQERLCETLGLRGRQLQLTAELIALLAPHGASVQLAEAYLRQGDVSTLLKRFDAADRALATSLRISRECGDTALERNALRSIGLLRWHQDRYADALAITENALEIDRQRGDDVAVAGDLSNLANILRGTGDYQRALAAVEEALALPAIADDPIKRAYILQSLARPTGRSGTWTWRRNTCRSPTIRRAPTCCRSSASSISRRSRTSIFRKGGCRSRLRPIRKRSTCAGARAMPRVWRSRCGCSARCCLRSGATSKRCRTCRSRRSSSRSSRTTRPRRRCGGRRRSFSNGAAARTPRPPGRASTRSPGVRQPAGGARRARGDRPRDSRGGRIQR